MTNRPGLRSASSENHTSWDCLPLGFVIGHWSLVIGHWSLVIYHLSFVICHFLLCRGPSLCPLTPLLPGERCEFKEGDSHPSRQRPQPGKSCPREPRPRARSRWI